MFDHPSFPKTTDTLARFVSPSGRTHPSKDSDSRASLSHPHKILEIARTRHDPRGGTTKVSLG